MSVSVKLRASVLFGALALFELVSATLRHHDLRLSASHLLELLAYPALVYLLCALVERLKRDAEVALSVCLLLMAVSVSLPFGYERLATLLSEGRVELSALLSLTLGALLWWLRGRLSPARFELLCVFAYAVMIDSGLELSKAGLSWRASGFALSALPYKLALGWALYYALTLCWLALSQRLASRPRLLSALLSLAGVAYLSLMVYHPPLRPPQLTTPSQAQAKERAKEQPKEQPKGDIYIVIFDALRGDAATFVREVDPQGAPLRAFEALSKRALTFSRAHSASIATYVSLPQLLNLNGYQTYVRAWPLLNTRRWRESLPGRLQEVGYETHLLSDYPNITLLGFDAELWDNVAQGRARHFRLFNLIGDALTALRDKREQLKVRRATGALSRLDEPLLDQLERLINRTSPAPTLTSPKLVVLHLGVPHQPYAYPPYQPSTLPKSFDPDQENEHFLRRFTSPTPQELALFKQHYVYALRAADEALARVVRLFDERCDAERDLLIVTSDHGESFGEHGVARLAHGGHLYEKAHHVPLMLLGGGLKPSVIHEHVSNSRLPSTIFKRLQLTLNEQERPLPLERAIGHEELSDGERIRGSFSVKHPSRGSLYQEGKWRLIITPSARWRSEEGWAHHEPLELYDLERDPKEEHNLASERLEVIEMLKQVFRISDQELPKEPPAQR